MKCNVCGLPVERCKNCNYHFLKRDVIWCGGLEEHRCADCAFEMGNVE